MLDPFTTDDLLDDLDIGDLAQLVHDGTLGSTLAPIGSQRDRYADTGARVELLDRSLDAYRILYGTRVA